MKFNPPVPEETRHGGRRQNRKRKTLHPVVRRDNLRECYARLERMEKKLDAVLTLLAGR